MSHKFACRLVTYGFLAGTAGVKLLTSRDAKKVYTDITAAALRGKDEVLNDYALIRLLNKKNYRKLPKSEIRENNYKRVEPADFNIKSDGDNGFLCYPTEALVAGEYILLNISQHPIGNLKDLKVYPFRVP